MIVPVGENILVEPIKVDEVTAGGIYLPDNERCDNSVPLIVPLRITS